jgi:hypothetical protein
LADLAEQLQALTQEFGSFNVFNDIDAGGRLLALVERVSAGGIYCVLAANPFPSRLATVCTLLESGMMGAWHYARFEIPQDLGDSDRRALSEILRREVANNVARLEMFWPIPHHVDPAGTKVVPVGTESLWVFPVALVGHGQIEMRTSTIRRKSINSGGAPIQIDISDVAEGEIFLDDVEQFTFREEECGVFLPEGIRLADRRLIEVSTEQLREALRGEAVLTCPSDRVAQFVARRNPGWLGDGNLLRLSGAPRDIDAGAFGRVRYKEAEPDKENDPGPSRDAKALWIESFLTAASSGDLISLLPWGKRPNAQRLTSSLLVRELAWLVAHIESVTRTKP